MSSDLMPATAGTRPRIGQPTPAAHRWGQQLTLAAAWLTGLFVVALWVSGGNLQGLTSSPTDAFLSVGRLTGMLASAALLVQLVMMARIPWLEQAWGQDQLARGHRLVGLTSFCGMLVHIALITMGYAAAQPGRIWSAIVDLTLNYPGVLLAVAGSVAMCLVVATSVRAARRRLRYESWHLIHLYG